MSPKIATLAILICALCLQGCNSIILSPIIRPYRQWPAASAPLSLGKRIRMAQCHAAGSLPDSACTPGAVLPNITADQVCSAGYEYTVPGLTDQERQAVYQEYGFTGPQYGYVIDHLISVPLGGSNDIANLWVAPQGFEGDPGFRLKQQLVVALQQQICFGPMPLIQAQQMLATNWVAAYQRYVEAQPPAK